VNLSARRVAFHEFGKRVASDLRFDGNGDFVVKRGKRLTELTGLDSIHSYELTVKTSNDLTRRRAQFALNSSMRLRVNEDFDLGPLNELLLCTT